MKKLSLTFFIALIFNFGFAQNKQLTDSLKHELRIAKHDTNRVLLLVELVINYQNVAPDSALRYGQQALDLAQKIKFLRGQARAFYTLGSCNRIIGDIPKTLNLVFKALQIAEDNNFRYELSRCYNLLGVFFTVNLGDEPQGRYHLMRGLAMIKTVPASKERWIGEDQILRNLGSGYLQRKNLDSAMYYYLKASKIQREEHVEMTPLQINNWGRIEFLRGNTQKAMAYSHQAIQVCKRTNNHRSAGTVYNTLATYFKDLNQPDSAIYYAKIALTESQSIDFKSGILESSSLLAELYDSKDIKEAYRYQKIAVATNEEINGLKKYEVYKESLPMSCYGNGS